MKVSDVSNLLMSLSTVNFNLPNDFRYKNKRIMYHNDTLDDNKGIFDCHAMQSRETISTCFSSNHYKNIL